jgi:hypothetical protein
MRYEHALEARAPADGIDAQPSALRAFSLGAMSINGLVRTELMLLRGGLLSPETLVRLFTPEGRQSPHDGRHPPLPE